MKCAKFLSLMVLGIFLLTNVSAIFLETSWENEENITTIEFGESATFDAYVSSGYPPITISIELYDSDDALVHAFQEQTTIEDIVGAGYIVFNPEYTVTESSYTNSGEFTVKIKYFYAVQGTQESPLTKTLTLIVNPSTPTPNNPPVITSTAITKVNELQAYSYQVTATDADSDTLTYSLTENPTWLSIDSSGLITGTAPSITADATESITISVSDSTDSVTQTYTLTIKDVPSTPDTTDPTITILSPEDGQTYNSPVEFLNFIALDSNLASCEYSTDNGTTKIPVSCVSGALQSIGVNAVEGSNTWTVYATDSAGNDAELSITFTVDTSVPDTQAPIITIVSPEEAEYDEGTITLKIITSEDATVEFSLDDGDNITMNNPEDHIFTYTLTGLSDGDYEVVFYATDTGGNLGTESITFSVKVEDDEDEISGARSLQEDEDFYDQAFLNQFKPKTIYLEEPDKGEEGVSFLQKFINAIINFFKKLFGLK